LANYAYSTANDALVGLQQKEGWKFKLETRGIKERQTRRGRRQDKKRKKTGQEEEEDRTRRGRRQDKKRNP
jgi:hypothetical protein